MKPAKYADQEYITCEFYGPITNQEISYEAKVVKIRCRQKCVNCRRNRRQGIRMLRESCIIEGEGRRSAYTCLPCLDVWIDFTKGRASA